MLTLRLKQVNSDYYAEVWDLPGGGMTGMLLCNVLNDLECHSEYFRTKEAAQEAGEAYLAKLLKEQE